MKKTASRLLIILGFLFITAYIRSATVDVVYTDYVRIVNTYLPDAWSFKPYLQPDILTRVPISYPERILSTCIFGYSTVFDMIMGAVGLTLSALAVARYADRRKLSTAAILAVLFVIFSLDKWEMLTNGTGWMHFWAFALFYTHYNIYDRIREGTGTRREEIMLRVLPFVTILLFAGPYCVIYAGAMGIVYVTDFFTGSYDAKRTDRKDWILRIICLGIPFILFCISKYLSVDEYAGATSESLLQVIKSDPAMLPKMVLKSFASMVIGGETAMQYGIGSKALYLMGLFIIAAYVYAIYINIKSGLYKKTAFPMLLIISGLISHAIVVSARWIFKSPDYMMSSRYALQYQSGILGIMLTICMAWKCRGEGSTVRDNTGSKNDGNDPCTGSGRDSTGKRTGRDSIGSKAGRNSTGSETGMDSVSDPCGSTVHNGTGAMRPWLRAAGIIIIAVVLAGHLVTTGREIHMAQYRKEAFENVRNTALNYERETDGTLKQVLQYSKPDMTRKALKTLQDHKLNVFR